MASLKNNRAQTLTEFIIAFPVILYFVLVIVQLSLIYNAHEVVNYAAYCSARAGIVFDADTEKMKKAASMASVPIAGTKLPSGFINFHSFDFPEMPGITDSSFTSKYIEKYYCSSVKTEIQLENRTENELTVNVTHHYQLIVPGIGVVAVPLLRIYDMPLYEEAQSSSERFGAPHLPVKGTCTLPF